MDNEFKEDFSDENAFVAARRAQREALKESQVTEDATIEDSKEQPIIEDEAVIDSPTDDTVDLPVEDEIVEETEALEDEDEITDIVNEDDSIDEDEDLYTVGETNVTESKLKTLLELEKTYKKEESLNGDYTKKSQANAELKEQLEAELAHARENNAKSDAYLQTVYKTPEELATIREEYGAEAYLEAKEKQEKLLENAELSKVANTNKHLQITPDEQKRTIEMFPDYITTDENGNKAESEKFKQDMIDFNAHVIDLGFTPEEISSQRMNCVTLKLLADSRELKLLKTANKKVAKKAKKAVIASKGGNKKVTSSQNDALKAAKAKQLANPTGENFAAIRRIEREMKK